MKRFELYIPPQQHTRNAVNGRFMKGHIPFNKGKKWTDYMDMRKAKRVKRIGMKNMIPGNKTTSSRNAKPVVAILDGKIKGIYRSSYHASRLTGICSCSIRLCCSKKRKSAGGYKWFWERDNSWLELIKQNEDYGK